MAIEIFMHAEEVPGIYKIDDKSDFKPDKNKFVRLESISQGITRPIDPIQPSAFKSGIRTSRVEHGHIIATRSFDASSIQLLKAHTMGIRIKRAHIFGCRTVACSDATGKKQYREFRPLIHIVLSDVVIADYQYAINDDAASESLGFRYTSIGWRLRSIKRGSSSDELGNWSECFWDGAKNEGSDKVPDELLTKTADKLFEDAEYDGS